MCVLQCTDVHMVSDSEGDDFEDAPEFGVDESEVFGSSCRKSPMSKSDCVVIVGADYKERGFTYVFYLPPVPENSENEGDALMHFTAEFSRR